LYKQFPGSRDTPRNAQISVFQPYRSLVRSPSLLIVALLVSATACTADTSAEPSTTQRVPGHSGSTVATPSAVTPTTVLPEVATTLSGRPLAPDFTLALGDGGSYTLSEGAKPVYLVFWAEW
jgi:hypothetical protein